MREKFIEGNIVVVNASDIIHLYTPKENAIIERCVRTIKELTEARFLGLSEARKKLQEMIDHYNNERLPSSLHYLRPIDYYKDNPIELLRAEEEKMAYARGQRKSKKVL